MPQEEGSNVLIGHLREFDVKSHDWTIFKPRLVNYFEANAIQDEVRKRAIFLNLLSEQSYKLMFDLCLPAKPEAKSYSDLLKVFNKHFKTQQSVFAERFNFYNAKKMAGESINDWAARVRSLAVHCEFGNELSVCLRDKFIMGIGSGPVLNRLFEEDNKITFEDAIRIAGNKETSCKNAQEMTSVVPVKQELMHMRSEASSSAQVRNRNRTFKSCNVCGRKNHSPQQCQYRKCVCHICNTQGHLAPVCPNKNRHDTNSKNKPGKFQEQIKSKSRKSKRYDQYQNFVDVEPSIFVLSDKQLESKAFLLQVCVENIDLEFQIDTGASISAISDAFYTKYFKSHVLNSTKKQLLLYTGDKFKPLGTLTLTVKYGNKFYPIEFYVIKNGGPPILGRDFLNKFQFELTTLNYICEDKDVNNLLHKFKPLFESELGTFNKSVVQLVLKDSTVPPKFFRPRSIPYAIKPKVENELDRLLNLGVILPVEYSEWATPIVPVLKPDGSVRICGDFKVTINPHLLVNQYPLPRAEDLFAKLNGGITFTKLDLTNAYQQMLLDEDSKKLVTISTHKGLFQYQRLPFGVASAPAVFQKSMETLLLGVDGVINFLDDVLITGCSKAEHLQRLAKVLDILQDSGLKLSLSKCSFFRDSVTYLGFVIDKYGLHPCESKLVAIRNAPVPENVTQLKAFLGLVNYYGRFVRNLSEILHPLYQLLKKDVQFKWTEKCDVAFVTVKNKLTSNDVLVHYNPALPLKLVVDASNYGVGAILCHIFDNKVEKPIAYASRSLSSAEQKYSQIEKEGLAIIFGVNKFNDYLYLNHFTLVTDHKPLLNIFSPTKGIPQYSANRLRRWALILSNYNYKIEYVKSEHNAADCLSRLPIKNEIDRGVDVNVDCALYVVDDKDLQIKFEDIAEATRRDMFLKRIINFVRDGSWPSYCHKIDQYKPFLCKRNELTVEFGCLLWNNRIVVPDSLRKLVLKELHNTHLGVEKMKGIGRSYFWWPEISQDIENVVKRCRVCFSVSSNPERKHLSPWKWPEKAWERIHVDFLGPFLGYTFLVVVDAHSKWLEVCKMNSITTESTIKALRYMFCRFGLPKTLVSDNGTQFTSHEFSEFMSNNSINHILTPPFHAQSNGEAEASVKIVKTALKKAIMDNKGKDIDYLLCNFLFDYRNSVHSTTGVAPSELLFRHKVRDRFSLLSTVNESVKQNVCKSQTKQIKNFKGHRNVTFSIGDQVLARAYGKGQPPWLPGIVKSLLSSCISLVYIPKLDVTWKRHVDQLKVDVSSKNSSRLPVTSDSDSSSDNDNECLVNVRPKRTIKAPQRLMYD